MKKRGMWKLIKAPKKVLTLRKKSFQKKNVIYIKVKLFLTQYSGSPTYMKGGEWMDTDSNSEL